MERSGKPMREDSICALCQCLIKENTFFSDLNERQIDAFKEHIKGSIHKKRRVIYLEGDECNGLYIIRLGRVKLVRSAPSGREQIIRILEPGGLLGLEAFYNKKTYTNTAISMEDTDLCYLERSVFLDILADEPKIAVKIMAALSRELDHAYETVGNLGLMSAREKLAHLLYSLSLEYGVKENGVLSLHLNLSRLEMAELLGITQETSIRLLKSFKEEGILDIKRKELVIKALDELKRISGVED
jgi:CRP-like cAMP-binding protein